MARKQRKLTKEERLSPFAHHPRKPGTYVLYVEWPEKSLACTPIYALCYGAKRHLDILLNGLKTEVIKDDQLVGIIDNRYWLVAENGIRVRSSRLQEIIDHEDNAEEANWEMPAEKMREIEMFRYGETITPKPQTDITTEKKRQRKAKRSESARPRKSASKPDGMITVAMIAESLNIPAREARARLRKAKVEKPELGWMWLESEAEEVKSLIAGV